ncbi:hypothetical protein P154DRAFT_609896, partial [Amniculicola lignicola CBS 123094]
VKICVSSHLWTVFEHAFGAKPSLQLEDLTRNDMRERVRSKFGAHRRFIDFCDHNLNQAQQLQDNIVEKSEGVFLWTQLVTQSLLEGLSGAEKPTELQRRLDALSKKLENLFREMLKSLDKDHYARASQLFQLTKALVKTLTLLVHAIENIDHASLHHVRGSTRYGAL